LAYHSAKPMQVIDHIKVFSGMLIFIVGLWASLVAFQNARSYGFPFLKPIAWYTLLFSILILGFIITKYSELNLPESLQISRYRLANEFVELAGSILVTGLIYLMGRIFLSITERRIPKQFVKGIYLFVICIIISYFLKMALWPLGFTIQWLEIFHSLVFNNLILLEIPLVLFLLVAGMRRKLDVQHRQLARTLAILLISRYIVVVIVFGLFTRLVIPEFLQLILGHGILLYIVLIPFLWICLFIPPYSESLLRSVDGSTVIETIFQQYNITRREKEIVRLILDGKSNKEIKEALFISYHTVKNHIYNIYQKLGINTRYELVHFILKHKDIL
jgi:DNA-binding CsgD family transcriptional regulator